MEQDEVKILENFYQKFTDKEKEINIAIQRVEEKMVYYEKAVQNLEAQIDSILFKHQSEKNESDARIQELITRCSAYSDQKEQFKVQIQNNEKFDKIYHENRLLNIQNSHLKTSLEEKAENEKKNLENHLEEKSSLEGKVVSYKQELISKNSELDNLKEKYIQFKEELSQAKTKLNEYKEEETQFKLKITELKDECTLLKKEKNELKDESLNYQQRCDEYKQESYNYKQMSDEYKEESYNYKQMCDEYKQDFNSLKTKYNELKEECYHYQIMYDECKEECIKSKENIELKKSYNMNSDGAYSISLQRLRETMNKIKELTHEVFVRYEKSQQEWNEER